MGTLVLWYDTHTVRRCTFPVISTRFVSESIQGPLLVVVRGLFTHSFYSLLRSSDIDCDSYRLGTCKNGEVLVLYLTVTKFYESKPYRIKSRHLIVLETILHGKQPDKLESR